MYYRFVTALILLVFSFPVFAQNSFGDPVYYATAHDDIQDVALTGDFDGDSLEDLIRFTRSKKTGSQKGDVYVSLSQGTYFLYPSKWHDWFAIGNEVPLVGDFDGDGMDDIVTFTRGSSADVYVALSDGVSFNGTGSKWHDWFAVGNEIPLVGDFNGDGMDDIASFNRGANGDVFVALSNGSSFVGVGDKWHDFFVYGNEVPLVGDFNGDGKDDIASLYRSTRSGLLKGDVFVSLSNGSSFQGNSKWHNWFCIGQEEPQVADFDGDGKDDLIAFAKDTWNGYADGDVYVTLSTGNGFTGTSDLWHHNIGADGSPLLVARVDSDSRADVVILSDRVYVSINGQPPLLRQAKNEQLLSSNTDLKCSPNPVRNSAIISYQLADEAMVTLSIHDLNGRIIKQLVTSQQSAGSHQITLETSDLPAGIYFGQLQVGKQTRQLKIVVQ